MYAGQYKASGIQNSSLNNYSSTSFKDKMVPQKNLPQNMREMRQSAPLY